MKFKIVYDKPQRIRFRCGAYAFDKEYEGAIYNLVTASPYVNSAQVSSANGGILVNYTKGSRSKIIDLVRAINVKTLKKNEPSAEFGIQKIDSDFHDNLFTLVAKHYLSKMFLPAPIRTAITLYRSAKYIKKALKTLWNGKLTVDVLDGASVVACLCQRKFKTAATVMFMLRISGLLEEYTHARTKAVLTDSLAIKTDRVWLVTDDGDVLIPIEDLRVGDKIRVQTGKVIPVDGVVADGEATVNESSMTGEPLPVLKREGISVYAGTVIEEGSIVVTVRQLASNTKISKIIELIGNSEELKAGVQSRAEALADRIVPFSFIGFFATLIFTKNITRAVSLLMVDYSCAIKLSTPIAVISAVKEAADNDITIKGGKYLEAFANADTIVFDKTGTLTNAEPVLEKVVAFGDYTEDEVLRISACLEEHFPHSVANAVVIGAEKRGISHSEEHTEVEYVVAHGIATTLHGKRAIIGSKHFVVEDENVTVTKEQQNIIDEKSGSCSVLYLAIGGELSGALCISDPPRKEAKQAIDMLKKQGIKNVVMLTGDSYRAAKATAAMLGITDYKCQVLPEDKHRYVEEMKQNGQKVIMVGDGINDAPALARADVGIAIGAGTDVAIESADIVLMKSDLLDVSTAIQLSKAVIRNIKQNLFWAFIYNIIGIPVAAGVFYLPFAWKLNPMIGAFAMSFSSVFVVSNALRLRWFKAKHQANTERDSAPMYEQTTIKQERKGAIHMEKVLNIEGMVCGMCVKHVDKALRDIQGIKDVDVSLESKSAQVQLDQDVPDAVLKAAIEDAGYQLVSIQ